MTCQQCSRPMNLIQDTNVGALWVCPRGHAVSASSVPPEPSGRPEREYTINLPLPPQNCKDNGNLHWRIKGKAKAAYKADCTILCKAARIPPLSKAIIELDFYCAGRGKGDGLYRPTDESNAVASFKAGQDAIVLAGILPDDSRKYLTQGPVRIHSTKAQHKGRCGVVVTLRESE